MLPDDPRHGSSAGYDAHRRDGEPACRPCLDGAARYEYERRTGAILGRSRTTSSLGTARRVQALVALGWTFGEISACMGQAHDYARKIAWQTDAVIRTSTAEKVDEVFRSMCMTTPPQGTGNERRNVGYAQTVARRYGWHPPLAWDNIDDPNEQPKHNALGTKDPAELQSRLDMAVVWRLVDDGARVRKLSGAEAREAWRILVGRGLSTHEIEKRYGLNSERYGERVA